jgi:Rrf2 family nitric oxide-sensitive transcriptional repressor
MRLALPAHAISVGAVLRKVEDDFALVECYREDNACRITGVCRLKHALNEALTAYLDVLDEWTLAELVARPKRLMARLAPREAG